MTFPEYASAAGAWKASDIAEVGLGGGSLNTSLSQPLSLTPRLCLGKTALGRFSSLFVIGSLTLALKSCILELWKKRNKRKGCFLVRFQKDGNFYRKMKKHCKANGGNKRIDLKASLPWPRKDDLVEDTGLGRLLSAWKWPKRCWSAKE